MNPQDLPQPDSKFDFIMKSDQKAQQAAGPKLPGGNLPRTLLIAGGGVFLVALLFVAGSLVFGKGDTKWQPYINLSARAQEIVRVSGIVSKDSKDSDTLGVAATTEAVLTSQQNELNAYLKTRKVKIDPKAANPYLNMATDASLASAAQNNALENTYLSYLKIQLNNYEDQLRAAAPGAGTNGLVILKRELANVQTILASPQLAQN